jgi:uncharacterized protein YaiE (UPF0345 family)
MIATHEYFDAKVKSLGYATSSGNSTVGVMEPGAYTFDTSSHETMTVIEGSLSVLLPDETTWKLYEAGTSFEVAAQSRFKVKTVVQTSYLCQYQ